jgi:hypothetical protein
MITGNLKLVWNERLDQGDSLFCQKVPPSYHAPHTHFCANRAQIGRQLHCSFCNFKLRSSVYFSLEGPLDRFLIFIPCTFKAIAQKVGVTLSLVWNGLVFDCVLGQCSLGSTNSTFKFSKTEKSSPSSHFDIVQNIARSSNSRNPSSRKSSSDFSRFVRRTLSSGKQKESIFWINFDVYSTAWTIRKSYQTSRSPFVTQMSFEISFTATSWPGLSECGFIRKFVNWTVMVFRGSLVPRPLVSLPCHAVFLHVCTFCLEFVFSRLFLCQNSVTRMDAEDLLSWWRLKMRNVGFVPW